MTLTNQQLIVLEKQRIAEKQKLFVDKHITADMFRVGKGASSVVYCDKKTDIITKISFDDSAYTAFASKIVTLSHNVWFPTIYSFDVFQNEQSSDWQIATVTKMEKLKPIIDQQYVAYVRGFLLCEEKDLRKEMVYLRGTLSSKQHNDLVIVKEVLVGLMKTFRHDLFIPNNIMLRGDQLVIIDPITISTEEWTTKNLKV